MRGPFRAKKVTDNVYWVGAIDWKIRNFHGYETSRGTTYNAFLIMADKVTLIDTVKAPFKDELFSRISSVIEPEKIDIIVSNHSEMDHSGNLMEAIKIIKPEKVYASVMGEKALQQHFHTDHEITAVKSGDKISLGNMTLSFLETRMLHWPDSMFSYLEEEKLLFSQDAFGMHLSTFERFDDEVPDWLLEYEAAKYYANILTPFSPMVKKLIKQVSDMNLEFDMVAPDHGPIWRKNFGKILGLYDKWSAMEPTDKAVVVFDTMWKSTEVMARAVGEGLVDGGAKAILMSLDSSHRSDVATEVLDAGALVVGSPTMNNNIYPTLADCLTYLRGLNRKNLVGAAFGSYGWSGQSTQQIEDYLNQMKIKIVNPMIKVQYVPTADDLQKCYEMGKNIASQIVKTPVAK